MEEMEEVFGVYLDTLGDLLGLFTSLPLWLHLMVTVPMSLFLAWRSFHLVYSIAVGLGEVETVPNQLIQKKNRPKLGQSEYKVGDFSRVEKLVKEGFTRISSEKGEKVFSRLKVEYDGLQSILIGSKVEETVLNLSRITKLTNKLYEQGLNFLSQALNVARQLSTSSPDELLSESEELKDSLNRCKPGSTLYNMVTERLSKNAKSLSVIKGYDEKLDEYFCQVGLCRDSIREIRLEIPKLLGNKPQEELDKVLLELRTRVEFAQRVQEEYDKQGI